VAQTHVRKSDHTEIWQTMGTYDVLVARVPIDDRLTKNYPGERVIVTFTTEVVEFP
jgi:hypothetical protein